jgi:tRNA threonylcarbamoyladenosine biosynthesis protein TsaB
MNLFLLLNTAADPAELGLAEDTVVVAKRRITNKRTMSERLLAEIDSLLRERSVKLAHVSAIGIVNRGGSFTSLRLGVAVANALAAAHDLPIVGVRQVGTLEALAKATVEGLTVHAGSARILPEYDRPPTITPPKF